MFFTICYFVKQYGYEFEGYKKYHNWATTINEFFVSSIKKEIEKVGNVKCFEQAVLWSEKVNEKIQSLPKSKSFEGVKEIIENAQNMLIY